MLSKFYKEVSILDEDYASIKVFDTTHGHKVIWLGIKLYSYTSLQVETLCYILNQCLEQSTNPLIIYFEHLTKHNADVPDFDIMKQIAVNLLGSQRQIKKKVSLTIFHPKKLDSLTKTGFRLLSTMYTIENLYISDSNEDIDEYTDKYLNKKLKTS